MYTKDNTNLLKGPNFASECSFMRLPITNEIDNADYVFMGIPFETFSNQRTGSSEAPSEVRKMSKVLRNQNLNYDINIKKYLSGVDYGNVRISKDRLEESLVDIEEAVSKVVNKGVIPILVGGNHFLTIAKLRALVKENGQISLIVFDSQLDYRSESNSIKSSNEFWLNKAIEENLIDINKSVLIGLRGTINSKYEIQDLKNLGFKIITTSTVMETGIEKTCEDILENLKDRKVFCSFDISFIDPAFAPAAGKLEVGGFSVYETFKLLRNLKDINYVGFEVVEYIPVYDFTQRTGFTVASLIHEFLAILANKKRLISND